MKKMFDLLMSRNGNKSSHKKVEIVRNRTQTIMQKAHKGEVINTKEKRKERHKARVIDPLSSALQRIYILAMNMWI